MLREIALVLVGMMVAGVAAASDGAAHRSFVVGGDVDIHEAVDGPVVALGGNISITAPVNGNLRMAGGDVKVGSMALISGDASIAGGDVAIDGAITGNLRAAAGDLRINGPIAGDASVAAGTLELGPDARIQGRLFFHGHDLRRDPRAQVLGGIEHSWERGWRWPEPTLAERFTHGWMWTAGLMLVAALIAGALPGASQRMARELRERPWITPLVGLVALTCIPIAAVLLVITIIGIPIAVLAVLGYVALLLLGYVWLAVVVGAMLLDRMKPETAARTAWRVGAAMLAMLVLAVLVHAPIVGGLFKLVALALGVGMIVAVIFRRSPAPGSQSI